MHNPNIYKNILLNTLKVLHKKLLVGLNKVKIYNTVTDIPGLCLLLKMLIGMTTYSETFTDITA